MTPTPTDADRQAAAIDTDAIAAAAIDTHAHVFRRGLPVAPEARYVPDYDALPARYLAMLDAAQCVAGVLVQPSFLGTDNRYLLAALAQAPERLAGIAVVAPGATAQALRPLAAAGIVGLRLNLIGQPDPDLFAPDWQALLRAATAARFQIEIQAQAHRLARLLPQILVSDVPAIVLDHFALPDPTLGVRDPAFQAILETAARTPRLYLKLSAPYRLGGGDALALMQAAKAAFGARQLMWGSDWPHTAHEADADPRQSRALLAQAFPEPELRRQVLLETPARLFGLPLPPALRSRAPAAPVPSAPAPVR